MSKKQTKLEKEFSQKIEKFCKSEGCSLSKLLNHKDVSYSNIDKVRDFVRGEGTLTMQVAGRIDAKINHVEQAKKSPCYKHSTNKEELKWK